MGYISPGARFRVAVMACPLCGHLDCWVVIPVWVQENTPAGVSIGVCNVVVTICCLEIFFWCLVCIIFVLVFGLLGCGSYSSLVVLWSLDDELLLPVVLW